MRSHPNKLTVISKQLSVNIAIINRLGLSLEMRVSRSLTLKPRERLTHTPLLLTINN
jgi:hypothetical protein